MLLFSLFFTLLSPLLASQEVIVEAEQTIIREDSNETSEGLAFSKKGSSLYTSSSSRDGWFKVQLPTKIYGKKFGWVKKSDVKPIQVLYPDSADGEKKNQKLPSPLHLRE